MGMDIADTQGVESDQRQLRSRWPKGQSGSIQQRNREGGLDAGDGQRYEGTQ